MPLLVPVILGMFLIGVVVVIGIVVLVVKAAQSVQPAMQMSRPGGGSMGRLNEQMNAKQAANTIYGNLHQQGGFQQGRVYSTRYLGQMAGVPYIADPAERWSYWSMVFTELNLLMDVGGYGYYGSPYQYGGDYAFGFGQPDVYYGDPGLNPMPFDTGAAQMMDLNQPQYDPGVGGGDMYDPSQGVDPATQLATDTGFDFSNSTPDTSSSDFGSTFDGGGSDFGSSDFGGGSDFGGSDSG